MLIEYMLSAQSLCELPIPQPECDRIVIGGDVEEEEEEEDEEEEEGEEEEA